MRPSWCTASIVAAALLSLASGTDDEMKFSASVFDKGAYLRIRLRATGGQAPEAIGARPVVDLARAGGKELELFDAGFSKMDTEVGRPGGDIITWIDLKAPPKAVQAVEVIEGKLEVLAGGDDREVRLSGFPNKRSRKLASAELKQAGIEVSASVTTEPVVRIVARNGTGRVTGLRMKGKRVDYHSTTDPERASLVAHARKGVVPRGAVVEVEVKDAAGVVHTFELEDLQAGGKPRPLAEDELKPTGVELTIVKAECRTLRVRAKSRELELLDVLLATPEEDLPCDFLTTSKQPRTQEIEKAYADLPAGTELVVRWRAGAQWVAVPLVLRDLPILRD